MVINGGSRSGSCSYTSYLGTHLQRTDTNERVHVRELHGIAAIDVTDALREMSAVGEGSGSRLPLYHANIDWRHDERMTDAQKARAVDRLAEELGLSGQPRVVVEHVKKGREHLHVVWSRIDGETMCAIPDNHNYRRHEIVARELEREFGHVRVQGAHHERDGVERPARCPTLGETRQADRSGMTPEEAKAQLRELWQSADNGHAFAAALDNAGWTLAQGERRGFVALDPAGEVRAVNKDITGLTAAKVRERLADLDGEQLPTVDQARDRLRERQQQPEPAITHDIDREALNAAELEAGRSEAEQRSDDFALDAAPAIDDPACSLKSPEEMRREWADLMRDGMSAEQLDDLARDPRTEKPAQDPEQVLSTPECAPEIALQADHLAERMAWAERLRSFATDTAQEARREPEPVRMRERTPAADTPTQAPEKQRVGIFQKLRDIVRGWFEKPGLQPAPTRDRAADRRHEAAGDRQAEPVRPQPAQEPTPKPERAQQPEAEQARPVERFTKRDFADELLAEARARLANQTPEQRAERDRQQAEQSRGRGDGSRERTRHHHSFLRELSHPFHDHSPRDHHRRPEP